MPIGTERYQTFDIYICKETYEPKGICYGKTCNPKNMTANEKILSDKVKTYVNGVLVSSEENISAKFIDINAYLTLANSDLVEITAYLLPDGAQPECMLAYPPCSEIDALDADVKWYRKDNKIYAELPLPEHCAVENFLTSYSENVSVYNTPSHIGEADGEDISLTFDDGGLILHDTNLDDTYLIPGNKVAVSYKLNGLSGYHLLGVFDFQTNIFTTATYIGCGLVKKQKIYEDVTRPYLGYSYKYTPLEGGIGTRLKDEWIFDTRLRFAVEYRGETYWLKSADFADYKLGERVAVIKSIDDAPLSPEPDITQDDTAEKLSEENDMIVQELFYN